MNRTTTIMNQIDIATPPSVIATQVSEDPASVGVDSFARVPIARIVTAATRLAATKKRVTSTSAARTRMTGGAYHMGA